jgi:hypothetical protein
MNKYLKVIVKTLKVFIVAIVIYETAFAITFAYFPKNFNSLMRNFKYYPDPDVPFPNYNLEPIGIFMSDGSYALLKYAGVFDLLMGDRLFITSAEHREKFEIETAKLSSNDENKLHEMIKKIVKVETQYYETGKEDDFEQVKDLFILDEEYNQFKEGARGEKDYYKQFAETLGYGKIKKTKFSSPRKYEGLDGRIGIISYTKFNISNPSASPDTLLQFYIFKRVDNEWKIEKCLTDISIRIEWTEEGFVRQIKEVK